VISHICFFKLNSQNRFAGLLTQVTAFMGAGGAESVEAMITKLEQLKGLIDQVHNQIRNPEKTTFVCVCIPEFLSIYETERLVQELSKSEIDTHNVVVNQVLFPDKDAEDLVEWYAGAKATLPQEAQDLIGKTIARKRMQDRYISQIFELYEDFHVILMPLLDNEVNILPFLSFLLFFVNFSSRISWISFVLFPVYLK
jgi:arsenite/tail-anchored protein-transporting ATPase